MSRLYTLIALSAYLFLGCGSYEEVNSFYADVCGNNLYNIETQFCYGSKIYDKCDGSSYDPATQKCENNKLFSKCGNNFYNQTTQFCQNSKIYDKCGGSNYDPLYQKCENNIIFSKCGNDYYSQATQFCISGIIYDKCGNLSYDPATQKCENNILLSKCGNNGWYNSSSQSCINNVVGNKEEFTDSRDGKAYKYVTIGTQIWMAENLRYETTNTKCYNNNPDNCKIYGMLYDWDTAKEVCPLGWHLPNDAEWDELGESVGNNGSKLKANNSAIWNANGTDEFGFTALPGGYFNYRTSDFSDIKEAAVFWSATAGVYSGSAHVHYINSIKFGLDGLYTDNSWVNVRCVKN